jgi:hypothetical protein
MKQLKQFEKYYCNKSATSPIYFHNIYMILLHMPLKTYETTEMTYTNKIWEEEKEILA